MARLWSAECLLLVWSDFTGMLLNATVKLVSCGRTNFGWKSLTSDLWAVTSSEIQSSDGGEGDKERHRSNSEQHSLRWFLVYVSHNRTMTLTYSLVAGLNGTYKRVCCSGDSRSSTFPWRLLHGDLLNPQMYTNTHAHTSCTAVERDIINLKMFVLTERNLGPQSHITAADARMKNLCCVHESVSGRWPLKKLSQDFQGLKVTRIHWNPQMGSLRSWCGCTFQERVDACSESTWI